MMKHSSGETWCGEPKMLHDEDVLRGNAVKETQKAGRRGSPQVPVKNTTKAAQQNTPQMLQ